MSGVRRDIPPRLGPLPTTGPSRLETILSAVRDRTQERGEHIAELNKRSAETDLHLKRLYDAIVAGVTDLDDPALKDRIEGLRALRDPKADSERAQATLYCSSQQAITPQMEQRFAAAARKRMRIEGGGYRRDHLRAFAPRVEVAERDVFIKGSKDELLWTLVAVGSGKSADSGVPVLYRNGGPCGIAMRTISTP
ncbi:hypothetical protein [Brucella sp. NBRC 12950]|uniref:hypothetical protein n=1 Tax=Brucella sp. NBRC 12950 TaxID=2994518 RepID=UPI0025568B29|nr:hypothetical protein [Brucella sp. NBRC 12950]